MATTIQISPDLQGELAKRKIFDRETYEEVIWDLIEDTMELSEKTKKNIEISRKQAKTGKKYSFESVMSEAGV